MLHIRLRELREMKSLTQDEVAHLLQITRGAYSMYEIGKRQMSYEALCLLADYYEVTTDYLLGRKNEDIMLMTQNEKEHIKKYRDIDERGKESINAHLEHEHTRLGKGKITKGLHK